MRTLTIDAITATLLCLVSIATQARTKEPTPSYDRSQGYYKDVFMDSGLALTSRTSLPACTTLNLSMEYFASASTKKNSKNPANEVDTLLQNMIMVGNPLDLNGVLLYPDGAPRFRMIYVNGGKSTSHGRSFMKGGLDRIREYVSSGGSYVGSCAGAFIASRYVYRNDSLSERNMWFGVWPGCVRGTALRKAYTTVAIEPNSALFSYGLSDFRMDVDSVRHNGGCYADVEHAWPEGTEILARFSMPESDSRHDLDGKPVIWAYKASAATGRVIPCGSHPESIASGRRLDLMTAMFRYAMDGNPSPAIKGELISGQKRMMNLTTEANDPSLTRIGDKQYHHFIVSVPKNCERLEIALESIPGWHDFDMYLFASPTWFAFSDIAQYRNIGKGVDKKIEIPNPKHGTYYISVFCNTTVDTVETKYGTIYTGRIDVLNGVPYSVTAIVSEKK